MGAKRGILIRKGEAIQTMKDVKVIISSGFMNEDQRNKLKEYTIEAFLDKPFTDEDIVSNIIKVLSR